MFSACTSIKVAALLNKIADLPKEHFSPLDPILYFQLLFSQASVLLRSRPVHIAGWYWQYIYTMEYYSAIKKYSFESGLMRWMKLEPIIQS